MDWIKSFSEVLAIALTVYSWIMILAFLLTWVAADPRSPLVEWVNRVTLPLWRWVERRCSYGLKPMAPYFALMLIYFLEIFAPGAVRSVGAGSLGFSDWNSVGVSLAAYAGIGGLVVLSYIIGFVMVFAVVWFIITLVNSPLNHPLVRAVFFIIDPFITPIQKILPRMKFDLSPLIVAVAAYFLKGLVMSWVPELYPMVVA